MNPDDVDMASLRSMLVPAPKDWLVAEPVSPLVNNVKNDGPELLGSSLGGGS
jgi:putative SOS response-associated peptidase YedK